MDAGPMSHMPLKGGSVCLGFRRSNEQRGGACHRKLWQHRVPRWTVSITHRGMRSSGVMRAHRKL